MAQEGGREGERDEKSAPLSKESVADGDFSLSKSEETGSADVADTNTKSAPGTKEEPTEREKEEERDGDSAREKEGEGVSESEGQIPLLAAAAAVPGGTEAMMSAGNVAAGGGRVVMELPASMVTPLTVAKGLFVVSERKRGGVRWGIGCGERGRVYRNQTHCEREVN